MVTQLCLRKLELQVLYLFYKLFLFFSDVISFQHVLHFGVARSQIEGKLKVKTVISIFTELPCSSTSFSVELTKLKNQTSSKHGNWHDCIKTSYSEWETSYIFVYPHTSCITDLYQSQLYIILYSIFLVNYNISITKTPTNIKFGMYTYFVYRICSIILYFL